MTSNFSTPILFLVFNRPDTTQKVWDKIVEIRPKTLFIACDAPRVHKVGEDILCQQVKDIVQNISWECQIQRLYRTENLGCRLAVSSGITWFFENVEQGIILEDDCLPSSSFFKFCEKMLNEFKEEESIMQISGSNFLTKNPTNENSYYLSTINDIWGWATWRRAWQKFSLELNNFDQYQKKNLQEEYFKNSKISNWFALYLQSYRLQPAQVWSTPWTYAMILNNGYTICPVVNLVQNIGFVNSSSTHAVSSFNIYQEFKSHELDFKMMKNKNLNIDYQADKKRFELIAKTDPAAQFHIQLRFKLYLWKRKLLSLFSSHK